jgi:hypothetical protein
MTDESIPPLRDLPPEARLRRKEHLLSEIARDAERRPLILLTLRPRLIAFAVISVVTVAAVIGVKSAMLVDADRSTSASPGFVDGSCAAIIIYRGQRYVGQGVEIRPVEGQTVGRATVPACNDGGDSGGDDQQVLVAAIAGVAPDVALTRSGQGDLYIREGIAVSELPEAVTNLVHAPSCEPADEPITLFGRWIGIAGADEANMNPPYDVRLDVLRSTPHRYERADLLVLVPKALGRPLDADDLHNSLWQGGTITITAVCRGGRFVATGVAAKPPA